MTLLRQDYGGQASDERVVEAFDLKRPFISSVLENKHRYNCIGRIGLIVPT